MASGCPSIEMAPGSLNIFETQPDLSVSSALSGSDTSAYLHSSDVAKSFVLNYINSLYAVW